MAFSMAGAELERFMDTFPGSCSSISERDWSHSREAFKMARPEGFASAGRPFMVSSCSFHKLPSPLMTHLHCLSSVFLNFGSLELRVAIFWQRSLSKVASDLLKGSSPPSARKEGIFRGDGS